MRFFVELNLFKFEGKVVFPMKCILGQVEKLLKYCPELDVIKAPFESGGCENITFCNETPYMLSVCSLYLLFAPLFFSSAGIQN